MNDPSLFLGRFHPLIVHFPIALLLLAALLYALAARGRARSPTAELSHLGAVAGLVLWLGAASAVLSAIAGWLLGSSGTYGGDLYQRHMWLGLAVAATSLVAALLSAMGDRGRAWRGARALMLGLAVCLLVPTGHLGATLTHGEEFLTEYAPSWLQGVFASGEPEALPDRPVESLAIYPTFVAPALQARCVTCHGPAKTEGGLRLDTLAGIAKGGDHGPVVAAGLADASEIVRRVWLPSSHEDAMPPKGHRPLATSEALLLGWWIEQGARGELTLADAELSPAVAPVIEALVGPIVRGGPAMPSVVVPAATTAAVAAAVAAGFAVEPVASGTPFLHVHATNAAKRIVDDSLAVLTGIGSQVLWLDLGGTGVTDPGMPALARLPNLTRLHLQRTRVGDDGVARLAALTRLEYLNLYGTGVTDAGVKHLTGLTSLRSLYLWQTGVTPTGIAALTSALPRLSVNSGAPASDLGGKPAAKGR